MAIAVGTELDRKFDPSVDDKFLEKIGAATEYEETVDNEPTAAELAVAPLRNSTNDLRLRASERAKIQKSLTRPHPSWTSTLMASSSSLQT